MKREVSNAGENLTRGGSVPRSNPLNFYINAFVTENVPLFIYFLWYPFHITSSELLLTTVNQCTVFKILKLQNQNVSETFSQSEKTFGSLLGPFYRPKRP